MDINEYPDLLTLDLVARLLNLSRVSVWRQRKRMVANGVKIIKLTGKIGHVGRNAVRIDRDSFFDYLDRLSLGMDMVDVKK